MSDAYLCNGCNEYYQNKPAATIDTTLLRGDIDLCMTCVREFKATYRTDK